MKKLFVSLAIACGIAGVAQSAQAEGSVDYASMQGMSGWACDPVHPSYLGNVLMYRDDNILVGSAQINVAREAAVNNACGGGTIHGFNASWLIDPALIDNKNHTVYFWYSVGGNSSVFATRVVGFCSATIGPSGLCP